MPFDVMVPISPMVIFQNPFGKRTYQNLKLIGVAQNLIIAIIVDTT